MGKVKDEAPTKSSKSAPKGGGMNGAVEGLMPFVLNLFRTTIPKPNQGKQARLWTAVGLAILVVAGIYRLYVTQLGDTSPWTRYGTSAALGLVLGWIVFRIVQYPPFVDFLIATEAEMNKVSWTSRDDLYRATTVVLTSVVIMALYLFVVDWVWSLLLQQIGVLRFTDTSSFGSTA